MTLGEKIGKSVDAAGAKAKEAKESVMNKLHQKQKEHESESNKECLEGKLHKGKEAVHDKASKLSGAANDKLA